MADLVSCLFLFQSVLPDQKTLPWAPLGVLSTVLLGSDHQGHLSGVRGSRRPTAQTPEQKSAPRPPPLGQCRCSDGSDMSSTPNAGLRLWAVRALPTALQTTGKGHSAWIKTETKRWEVFVCICWEGTSDPLSGYRKVQIAQHSVETPPKWTKNRIWYIGRCSIPSFVVYKVLPLFLAFSSSCTYSNDINTFQLYLFILKKQ